MNCYYCKQSVILEEDGSAYSINPYDESIDCFHIECMEVFEDAVVIDSYDDSDYYMEYENSF